MRPLRILGAHLRNGFWRRRSALFTGVLMATALPALASAPETGTDIIVNLPGGAGGEDAEAAPNCNTQNEVSMARFGNNLVAGWNDFAQCDRVIAHRELGGYPLGRFSLNGYGYSSDGGRTWTDGGLIPPPMGGHLEGDPVLAAGPDGTFYYAALMTISDVSKIGVARSTDGGMTWSTPADASPNRNPTAFQDKPWVATDSSHSPHRGSVYVAWTEYVGTLANDVLLSRSTDGGRTFSDPIGLAVPVVLGGDTGRFPGFGAQVAVGSDGEVYVGWLDQRSRRRFWLARSLDGGVSFLPQTFVTLPLAIGHTQRACLPQSPPRQVLNGDIRVQNWPSMAVDISGSSDPQSPEFNPYRGRIYLAIPHDADDELGPDEIGPYGDESDIAFAFSKDGGTTWENVEDVVIGNINRPRFPTVIINDDETQTGPPGTDQFHPQVAVDSDGRVAVSWYDRRVSRPTLENWDMAVFATVSTDGGETFGPNFQVGDTPFPPSRTNPNTALLGGCYMGEYNGMVGGVGEFLLAWGDNRDGPDLDADPNVYFDRITLHDPLATDDTATTVNGIPVTIDVLRNDSDPNGDPLTVTEVTQPGHGTATINPDNTVTYDPVCGFQGIETFTYTISDGQGGTDTGTVSVRARRTSRRGSIGC